MMMTIKHRENTMATSNKVKKATYMATFVDMMLDDCSNKLKEFITDHKQAQKVRIADDEELIFEMTIHLRLALEQYYLSMTDTGACK